MASPARSAFVFVAALSSSALGCTEIFGDRDAHALGVELGRYRVDATLTSHSCGEGALGSATSWQFEVELARDERALYWNNGAEIIAGELDESGVGFSFDSGVIIDMRSPEETALPACSVKRVDLAAGKLGADGADVPAFAGTLSYDFAPTEGSSCADLVSDPEPVFAALPCSFAYTIVGERIDPPH